MAMNIIFRQINLNTAIYVMFSNKFLILNDFLAWLGHLEKNNNNNNKWVLHNIGRKLIQLYLQEMN